MATRLSAFGLVAGVADNVCFLLLVVGALSAIAGWFPGVYLLIAGFCGHLACHLAIGVVGYREAMRRPWPRVEPLVDDDEW